MRERLIEHTSELRHKPAIRRASSYTRFQRQIKQIYIAKYPIRTCGRRLIGNNFYESYIDGNYYYIL